MEFDTGARLKDERERRRLSQRQLAAVTGVTSGMISMIEQNRTSPSVATLKKILAGLDISLGEFFAAGTDTGAKWHFRREEFRAITPKAKLGEAGAGVVFRQIGRPGASAIQMLHETYAAGADTGPELYSHDAEEAGVVIAGQILVTVGEDTQLLSAGDGYLFNSRTPHRFRNPGPAPCVIVSACTPPTF
ncbi:MAG: cupin domain-containing protein [Rhodobacteraceae bacterium]|jgi:transcriptional regulator with XRE-family HTH domain|uniref:cupin domain-containing protein n=1 Tax=Albidovulum sp. TaxID=1872424 RepID=UPI001D87187E|nr:cupin domain-containing protein [uncultured Defluviimonas sp.]MCB2127096.1 cupin domain-containing protein [Paracoccaceae bacterium]MCC0071635.1 cupin domain-containing protein [Paracoccaceae bacterium]